jgi:hypothetical protein
MTSPLDEAVEQCESLIANIEAFGAQLVSKRVVRNLRTILNAALTTDVERRSFAWTATSGYKCYPPYVNLTGNRLSVRGCETFDDQGHPRTGPQVAIDLPDEALSGLRTILNALSPDEERRDD